MRPENFTFNGLALGHEIDPDIEPTRCLWEFRNPNTQVVSCRSERIQVTIQQGRIIGIAALFFRALNRDVTFYSSPSLVDSLLGNPAARFSYQENPELFKRAFVPPVQTLSFRSQLLAWSYGPIVDMFFTKFDPYEGFHFPRHQFWSIAVGELWIPPD